MATSTEQLEAMRRLGENWDGYGAAAPQADVIDLAQELVGFFEHLLMRGGASTILHVSPTRAGGVMIEWEDQPFEHEIEISPDRSISFLHLDRNSGQIKTRQFAPEPGVVQAGFLHELRQLLAAA